MKIGILGLGKMGEALIKGIQKSKDAKQYQLFATTRTPESAKEASRRLGIECTTNNLKLAGEAQVLLICVKPHQVSKVLSEISPKLTSKHLVISIAASITNQQILKASKAKAGVIRAMPNTPSLIGAGMTVLSPGPGVSQAQIDLAQKIFSTVGLTAVAEEHLMDGVTGLSGCGPAYVYMIIEALSEAGVKVGLPRKTATLLAAQTLLGASQMVLERGEHPAALKDEVTTPAGCTIDGLMALEEGKLRVTLIKAVLAATRRSKKLRG
jgi:pyrroline-5-carboxylate reductase